MQVFLASPWIPLEWVKAYGLEPRSVWAEPGFWQQVTSVGAGVCAFAERVLQFAERPAAEALVFTTHCDQLRRAFDAQASRNERRTFLFNLPVTWGTAVAEKIFAAELIRLGKFLLTLGGHTPSAGELAQWEAHYDKARRELREAGVWCTGRTYAEAISRFQDGETVTLQPKLQANDGGRKDTLVPLALVGGPLAGSQLSLLDEVETAGGRIVLNATETGERSLGRRNPDGDRPRGENAHAEPGAESAAQALTRSCLGRCIDVFQRPNDPLYDWLREQLARRKIQGILVWHYFGCDLWRAEAQTLREAFGLPVLLLEADEASSAAGRSRGRIEAFLEALA